MKKFFIAALAALTLASCSKENTGSGEVNGGETFAFISVKHIASQGTRGAASAEEKNVQDLDVYVFNAAKALEQTVTFTTAEVASGKVFKTTSGIHYFLVAANKPAGLPAFTNGTNLAAIEQTLQAVANKAALDAMTVTTAPGKFFMTNIDSPVPQDLVAGGTQASPSTTVQLTIGRAMAKVRMSVSASVAQPNGTLKNTAPADVQYLVAGNPNSMHVFPSDNLGQRITPYFNNTFVSGTAVAGESDASFYWPLIGAADNYATFTAVWGNRDTDTYAVENSNVSPKFGESTYLIITGVYAPNVWCKKDGTLNGTAATHGDSFWRIGKKHDVTGKIESYTGKIYSETMNQTELDAQLTAEGIASGDFSKYQLVEYAGGRVFYGLWLADNTIVSDPAKKYAVKRNHIFKVSINEINGPGSNKPDLIPNPIDPIEEDAYIKAEITVEDWTVINQGGIIG